MINALAIAAVLGLSETLERYRPTTHGANPWTVEGVANVVALSPLFEKAARLVTGTITSCWRSERVNALVSGSPTSDHLHGRAVDLVSANLSHHDAAVKLFEAAERGELGNVREVLEEGGCCHIGWFPAGQTGKPRFGQWRM